MWLRIDNQPAQVGIRWDKGKFRISSKAAEIQIQNRPADLRIVSEPATLTIDQRKMKESIGLQAVDSLVSERGKKAVIESNQIINEIAAEGNMMADIHLNPHVIPQLAKPPLERPEVNLVQLPSHPPEVDVRVGRFQVQLKPVRPQVKVDEGGTEIEFRRGNVDVYLKQKPLLDIRVVQSKLDLYI